MFQDMYNHTSEDSCIATLGERYVRLLAAYVAAEEAMAQVKQAKGDRVGNQHAPMHFSRQLNWEVANLRLFQAITVLHPLLQPVWDEAQAVRRRRGVDMAHSYDALAVRQSNLIASEELYNLGCSLYWEYRILRLGVHYFYVNEAFQLQDAHPDCFVYTSTDDPALRTLTERFKVLHELYSRAEALREAIKAAKSNRVEQTNQLFLNREWRYEASVAAYRSCALQLHPLLQPLWEAAHAVRRCQDMRETSFDEVVTPRICVAAAEGLYKRAHAAFYAVLQEQEPYTHTGELYRQEPTEPRVYLMRDEVELGNPLPPPPYQTAAEAKLAGDKWVSFGCGYERDVIVDTRRPQPAPSTGGN